MKKKKIHILVGICSCVSAKEKRNAVRDTWLQHQEKGIKCQFFVGGTVPLADEKKDTVVLNVPDGYDELPEKVRAFMLYALANYDFDWLFKCDDDTYLRLDRLAELADPQYDLIGDAMVERRLSPGGGSGYFLSRRMVQKIIEIPNFPKIGPEDIIIGELAYKLGGKMHHTHRLFTNNTTFPAENNDMVSAHWCSPELLRGIHFMTHQAPVALYHGKHSGWSDEVQFFSNGFFRRTTTPCYGQWRLGVQGELFLKWAMWSWEQCLEFEDLYLGSATVFRRYDTSRSLKEIVQEYNLPIDTSLSGDGGLKVHLGSQERFLTGWLNLDRPYYAEENSLPWIDEIVGAFFVENTLEQHPLSNSIHFFREAFRMLVPGGVLRVCFTDFCRFSRELTESDRRKMEYKWKKSHLPDNGVELLEGYMNHKSFLSAETVTCLLEEAGFIVTEHTPGISSHPHLNELERTPSKENFQPEMIGRVCLEAQKPIKKTAQPRQSRQREKVSYVTPVLRPQHRTGNKLFQIAAVYAHALRHGLECRIPWNSSYESRELYNSLDSARDACPDGGYEDEPVYQEPMFSYAPIPAYIKSGALDGFFQSEKYFSDFEAKIRTLYRNLIWNRKEGSAGVHIRMGDYLQRTDMYHSPDWAFLEEALNRLSDNITELVIFSDNRIKALELIRSVPAAKKFELYVDPNGTIDAMRHMSSMQELILSCSSYSWWPAYLGDQEKVVIQKHWFTGCIHDYQDVYRNKWIRL